MTQPEQFYDLPSNEQENWLETATEWLVDHIHLPLSEDVWTDDKYTDQIHEKAVELWEESRATNK
jgi:hypothetical protein